MTTNNAQALDSKPQKQPYEPPRVTRKKSLAKATLFTGGGGPGGGVV
jgi:hypothetical protein